MFNNNKKEKYKTSLFICQKLDKIKNLIMFKKSFIIFLLLFWLVSCKSFTDARPEWCEWKNMKDLSEKSSLYKVCNWKLYYTKEYYVVAVNPTGFEYIEMDVSPSDFTVLKQSEGFDSKNMFVWSIRRVETDSQTYKTLTPNIDIDKNNIYCNLSKVEGIKDITSFEITGDRSWKDKEKVYVDLCWKWKAITLWWSTEWLIEFNDKYSKDEKGLYFLWQKVDGKYDIKTLDLVKSEQLAWVFFKDKKNIYATREWSENLNKIKYNGDLLDLEVLRSENDYTVYWMKDKINDKLYCFSSQANEKKLEMIEMEGIKASEYKDTWSTISTWTTKYSSNWNWCSWRKE